MTDQVHEPAGAETRSWSCNWDAVRPCVHPLRTRAGHLLTVDAPADHPWHHGLWCTIKFVDSDNFWEEYGDFGTHRVVTTTDLAPTTEHRGGVHAAIEWVRPDGETVALVERRTITEVAVDDTAYALDWRVELAPTAPTTFDRTPFTTWGGYGGLTLRGAPDWTDSTLLLADRAGTSDRVLGERARWCALVGAVAGSAVSVALFDHPSNPSHPTPWYASNRADTYGDGWANFANAAFLWDGPQTHPGPGHPPLVLRHLVVVADGPVSAELLDPLWRRWVQG